MTRLYVMHKRTRAREAALQALYQVDVSEGASAAAGAGGRERTEAFEAATSGLRLTRATGLECAEIFNGVLDNRAGIDALIRRSSEHWSIDRMALVDRNVLRIAAYELVHCTEIPFRVIIDEAVELAKRFGSEESGAFINGILDNLARLVGPGKSVTAQ